VTSQPMGRVSHQRSAVPRRTNFLRGSLLGIPFIAWSGLNCGRLWSVAQKFLSAKPHHACRQSAPTFLLPATVGEYVTRVMVSQWGHGGQRWTKDVYVTTVTAEHQWHKNKGMKEPALAVLKSPGHYRGECTCHSCLEAYSEFVFKRVCWSSLRD